MPVFDALANLAYSLVAVAPVTPIAGLSLTVRAGEGTRFPAPPFSVTAWPPNVVPEPSNAEIWRITGRSGDVLTGLRAQEGTSAMPVAVGYQVAQTDTAKLFTDIQSGIFAARAYSFFTT